MKKYCKICKKLTESSQIKRIKTKKLSFHVCLSCGNPYEYKSFKELVNVLFMRSGGGRAKNLGITKFGRAGTSSGTYNLYLCTNHWKEIRAKKLGRTPLCQVCKKNIATQVHHLRYNDENGKTILYHEKLEDLLSVCEICHKDLHSIQ